MVCSVGCNQTILSLMAAQCVKQKKYTYKYYKTVFVKHFHRIFIAEIHTIMEAK